MEAVNSIRKVEVEREEALQKMRELNDREVQMKDKEIVSKDGRIQQLNDQIEKAQSHLYA